MNNLLSLITIFVFIFLTTSGKEKVDTKNKIEEDDVASKYEIFFADPTIYFENDKYYLTGTRDQEPFGFAILESDNLQDWKSPKGKPRTMILNKHDGAYGSEGFWAPQILKVDNDYLFTYTANEQTVLAKSKSILGPYRQEKIEPIDGSEKNIDSYIFQDEDGKYYLYHVRFNKGNYLWVAEFDINKGKIKEETLKKCFDQTEAWEATPNYPSDPILEGPTVVKMKSKYYLFYSANHFMNIDYAMGYATADSPYGPWIKHKNSPVIHRSIVGENGSGHGDVFEGKDGQLYYVYHVHYSENKVIPRRTRIVPLVLKWNEESNLYDITVDAKKIIKPAQ
ncbi:MAG TPA: glycoside hydrolase family 43 protein [Draconibacterium sp.]|nr:glycoside hydrolase family 43 protein [Draconibacterium sp.]